MPTVSAKVAEMAESVAHLEVRAPVHPADASPLSFAQDPRPERLRLVGYLPRHGGDSPAILVRFESKPKMSEGKDGTAIHLPLSQQVEPNWARVVRTNARCLERIPEGSRVMVKAHMNGDRLEGTDLHWLAEDDVLGVEET